jgi:hypothetical protein
VSAVNDFERQLREAMHAMVADAEAPRAVLERVRRRYRRQNAWLALGGAAVIAIVLAAVPVASALRAGDGQAENGHLSGRPLFPGGGRILLVGRGELKWLYPDGQAVQIGSGFAGAIPAGGKLLAWKHANPPGAARFLPHGCADPDCTRIHDLSYYTMNLDGSRLRLVLPAEPPAGNTAFQYMDAQLSPSGSRLAYISQELRNGTRNIFLGPTELWSLDLATGKKTDLGPGGAPFAWRDDATILTSSPDRRSIEVINANNGSRITYLTVDDPRLVRAYKRARPEEGPPGSIALAGSTPGLGPSAVAVTVGGSKQAVMLFEERRIITFAPDTGKCVLLTLKLAASGILLLNSQHGECTCDVWSIATYVGTVHGGQLTRVETGISPGNSAVNPAGTVIAMGYRGIINFLPVPPPACEAAECLRFPVKQLLGRGTLLAWQP